MNLLMLAAAVAQAFNLSCTGTQTSDSAYAGHKVEAYTSIYRINLTSKKWCEEDCKFLRDFAGIDQTRLTLTDKPNTVSSIGSDSFLNYIDRETGENHIFYTARIRAIGPESSEWKGQCVKQPFTGFPTFNTKF